MRKCVNKIFLTLQAVCVFLATETRVFAHGIDELPGLGRNITVIMSVVWIIIVLGIVFFIRRLIRRDTKKFKGRGKGRVNNAKEP